MIAAIALRDAALFNAAWDVARDAAAGYQARAFALRAGTFQVAGSAAIQHRAGVQQCANLPSDAPLRVGDPITADAGARLISTARELKNGSSQPQYLREVAGCVDRALRLAGFRKAYVTGQITIVYLCRNRFAVRNAGEDSRAVTYDVERFTERGTLVLAGRILPAPYSSRMLSLLNKGTARIFVDGVRVASAANAGTACPGS